MFKRLLSLFLICSFVITSLPIPAFADDGTLPSGTVAGPGEGATNPPENPPPTDKEGGKGDQTGDTDPLLLHQGDFRLDARDLLIPSRGMPLEIKRTYRSQSRYNAMFGYGWDFSFNIRLRKRSNGSIVILTGDNRRNEFKKSGAAYLPPAGVYDTLTQNGDGSFQLTKKHGDVYQFDIDGKLITMSDRNGNTMTYTYDPQGKLPVTGTSPYFVTQTSGVVVMDWRLIQITDTVGRHIDLFYDGSGRLIKIKDFSGRILSYKYSPQGDLISFGEIPEEGLLPGETLMGYKTTYNYTNHNLERITDAKGKTYLVNVYNNEDRVAEQTYGDPLESGGTSTIEYEVLANQTTVTDRKGFKTIWTFNDDGNPIRKEVFTKNIRPGDPASYVTTYEYNTNLELTKITYPKGNVTENQYDLKGNLLETRRKGQSGNPDIVTTFTYEPEFNQIKTITDPRGNVTTYTYDYELGEPQKGNLRKITFPQVDGETIESAFTYNAFGQIDTAADPNANVAKYEYFSLTGYLKKITQGFGTPDASTTEFLLYDDVGNAKELKDPRGNVTRFTYDVNNNLKTVTSAAPFNYLTKYTYDLNGNLEKLERQSNAAGTSFQTTVYTYTTLDQLKTITDHDGNITTFEYDPNGNRKKVIDAELHETNYLYDERDLLYQVTDAESHVTTYSYDLNGNLETIKDANSNTTTYQYDEFDRLKQMIYPDASEETYTYDAASNLKTKTDPKSQMIQYDYDELNRLTFKTYNGCSISLCGGNVDYTYDAGSRLRETGTVPGSQGTVPVSTISYQYDALNRVKDVTTTLAASSFTLHYSYDSAGNRTQLTYPHGRVVKFVPDELNRLDKITNASDQVLYDFGYDTLSRRTSLSRPNGVSTAYGYDTINRLTSITHGSVASITYPLYDKVGNRKQMTDSRGTHTYTYDSTYQLTSSVIASASEAIYDYDAVGNRTTVSAAGTPASYTPNNLNQYQAVDGVTYIYDLNGNLINDGLRTYEYDYENRLISVIPAQAGIQSTYQYDPLGRRISKTLHASPDTLHYFYLYDGDQIIEVFPCNLTAASCTLTASFLSGPGIDEPLETINHSSSTTSYYHQDGLGSVIALTNSSGGVTQTVSYDAYGIPTTPPPFCLNGGAGGGVCYGFTGREYDSETGLYYYRSRYYSPKLGRFISRDLISPVIEFPESFHRYRYAFNNPLRYTDPDGEIAVIAGVAVGIVVIGTGVGAAIGAYQAYRAGESLGLGALRGAAQGFTGSATAVGVGLLTRNPYLIGAASAEVSSFIGQTFDRYTKGKSYSATGLLKDTVVGAILGPLVKGKIPLRGRASNVLAPRSFSELLKPAANTARLYQRVGLSGFYKVLFGEVTWVPELQGADEGIEELGEAELGNKK